MSVFVHMNCLVYWTLLFVADIFLVVIFLFPCDFVVMFLSDLSSDDGLIFSVFCFVQPYLGLL